MTILCLLACGPTVPALTSRIPLGGNLQHQSTLQVYAWLANACQERAGTVLADSSDGHPIEYYSACSVIADNFIITRQHEDKLREADRLMASSLDEVLAEAPYVRYIYVIRHDDPFSSTCGGGCPENRGLRAQLLFNGPPYPSRLKLLGKIDLKGADPNGTAMPLARVFEVTPAIPGVP